MIDEKVLEVSYKYHCESCDYNCNTKQNYNKHISTRKHKMLTHVDDNVDDKCITLSTPKKYIYSCPCGKQYKFRQSLHVHKKSCSQKNNEYISRELIDTGPKNEIVSVLLEQNTIFQELIMKNEEEKKELMRKNEEQQRKTDEQQERMIELHDKFLEALKSGSLGNTTNNTQNNQFNLQFYLNETCKDAINLDEFLKSIKLTTQDYVNTGEAGFIQGLTDIFRKELHKLEPHHRPLQCTDVKREVIYVKENNEWTKDIENKKSLNVVKRIDLSYQNMMYKWMEENPGFREEEGQLVEDGIKYSVVCFGRNRLDGNEPIFRGKILKNVLDDLSIKRGSKVITVK